MEVYSFTGKSGTGKSYQATRICNKYGIEAIIDDGILIYKGSIVAGSSAKKCESVAKAMRTTLFNYEDVRNDVKGKLDELKPDKILILGTSDRMVDWITDALDLPAASHRLYIEEESSPKDREAAGKSRNERGEHAIPAPMAQLRRDFAGYFMNPVRFIRNLTYDEQSSPEDRTVVRPTYSYYGSFDISEKVLEDIVLIAAERHGSVLKVVNYYHNGKTGALSITVVIRVRSGEGVIDRCTRLQEEIKRIVEEMTAFSVASVNITVRDIEYRHEDRRRRRIRNMNRRRQQNAKGEKR